MLDILGREVKRGDVIAYGSTKSGHVRYATSNLGIVNNILGHRTHLKDSPMYNKILKEALLNTSNAVYMPPSVDTIAKVTFYPLHISDKYLTTHPIPNKIHPNGKPKRGIVLTTLFLKISVEELTGEWLEAYAEARKAFRI